VDQDWLDQRRADRRAERRVRQQRRRRRLAAAGVAGAVTAAVVVAVVTAGSGGASGGSAKISTTRSSVQRAARQAKAVGLPPIPAARPGPGHVIERGPATRREVAITFDDGFCPACVRRIISYLVHSGDPATIFPNGTYGTAWEPVAPQIRRLVARGQLTVGNHTFNHVNAPQVGTDAFSADLARNERWIEKTFGITGRPYFRPPYGAYVSSTVAAAGALGYTKTIMWSGTLADSSPQTVPYLIRAIKFWAKPGAIILCHGNYPNTSKALAKIFAVVRAKHLRPVTLGKLLGGAPYRS
jgi:peptidoglycan/xylan/chitin deacetylase (PgdA/CDA1 family)